MQKVEFINYDVGKLYEQTVKDKSGNTLSYVKNKYGEPYHPTVRNSKYALPIVTTRKMNNNQDVITKYILCNGGSGDGDKAISKEETFLSTNGSEVKKSTTDYSYTESLPGRISSKTEYARSNSLIQTAYTYELDKAFPKKESISCDGTKYSTEYSYTTMGQLKTIKDPIVEVQ